MVLPQSSCPNGLAPIVLPLLNLFDAHVVCGFIVAIRLTHIMKPLCCISSRSLALAAAGLMLALTPFLLLAAERKVDISKLPPPSTQAGLTFDKDIKPIIEKSCLECHSGRRPKARYEVGTREAFLKPGISEEDPVIPGKSEESPVIHYVADLVRNYEMPPHEERETFPVLTREQIALLRAWIDQGAK
jgi:hypothetical protein